MGNQVSSHANEEGEQTGRGVERGLTPPTEVRERVLERDTVPPTAYVCSLDGNIDEGQISSEDELAGEATVMRRAAQPSGRSNWVSQPNTHARRDAQRALSALQEDDDPREVASSEQDSSAVDEDRSDPGESIFSEQPGVGHATPRISSWLAGVEQHEDDEQDPEDNSPRRYSKLVRFADESAGEATSSANSFRMHGALLDEDSGENVLVVEETPSPDRIGKVVGIEDKEDDEDGEDEEAGKDEEDEEDPEDGEAGKEGSCEAMAPHGPYSYAHLFQYGRLRLAMEVFERERESHRAIDGSNVDAWVDMAMPILLSVDNRLLEVLLHGNLHKTMQQNQDLRRLVTKLTSTSERRPAHYMFEFVNGKGEAPTAAHLLKIAEHVELYMEDDEAAWSVVRRIDNWKAAQGDWNKSSEEGMKRDQRRRYIPSNPAWTKIRDFLEKMREFLRGRSQQDPLLQPLREIGYTIDGRSRVSSHEAHNSSNWLMNLFEAAAADLNMPYRNRGAVIYLCWDRAQGVVGEILFSSLSQSYTKTGLGFNHEPAGGSNRSVEKGKGGKLTTPDQWSEWENDAWENGPFQHNIANERSVIARAKKREVELSKQRESLLHDVYPGMAAAFAAEAQPSPEHLPKTGLVAEFRRMEAAGEFASEDDRAIVENMLREHLLRRRDLWQTFLAETSRLNHLLRSMDDRLPDPDGEELYADG